MPAPSKIVDEAEVVRWIQAGWTYREIRDAYRTKYNIETSLSMWSMFRRRKGLDRRINRNSELIPWETRPEHRNNYNLAMLRVEARIREGLDVRDVDRKRHESWLRELMDLNAVVHYDPDTPDGFSLVPRLEGDDDLIRRPRAGLTRRRRAD